MLLHRRQLIAASAGLLLSGTVQPSSAAQDLWSALRGGDAIAVMRHAKAPGNGDPAGFSRDDCSTQRNLSAEGRSQAEATGRLFRAKGISDAHVFSSHWCRALDTARLLGIGQVEPLEHLDSFFAKPGLREPRTRGLLAWLSQQTFSKPVIFVSHQSNVNAMFGSSLASGEIMVAINNSKGGLELMGRIAPV